MDGTVSEGNGGLQRLSNPQKRVWYTDRLHPGTSMWNNAGTVRLTGEINFPLIERAVNMILENCPSLRTRIILRGDEPVQYAEPYAPYTLETVDFTDGAGETLSEWERRMSSTPTGCLNCGLYYFAALNLGGGKAGLYARVHHIISDAWTLVGLVNSITEAYDRLLCGEEYVYKETAPYSEYIEKEDAYLNSARCENDRKYLLEKFADIPEPIDMKVKYDSFNATAADRSTFSASAVSVPDVKKYCEDNDISPFSFMLSVFSAYVYRRTGKTDFVIGTSVLNRADQREKNTFGMLVSTVPLRIKIDPDMTFARFQQSVDDEVLSALRHQKYPFNLLMKELHERNKNTDPLFDITMSFQNAVLSKNARKFSYEVCWHSPLSQVDSFDAHFNGREGGDAYVWDCDFLTSLFDRGDIERMHEQMDHLLADALSAPDKKVSALQILSPKREKQLIEALNGPKHAPPPALTLARLFELRAKKSPSSTALISGGARVTAARLDRLANGFARRVLETGAGRDKAVIVMMRRTPALFTALLGILKAGAAFLPVDPETPAERVKFIARKSSAAAAVADAEFQGYFDGVPFIPADAAANAPEISEPPAIEYAPSSLAYIIFTSGTTGEPKGVMIENRSICDFIEKFSKIMDFTDGTTTLCVASAAFDLFVMESFPALTCGAALVLAGDGEGKVPENLSRLITDNGVNSIMFMPSRMQMLLAGGFGGSLGNIKQIMMGGEELTENLFRKLREHTKAAVYNFYGPTEATIAVTCQKVSEGVKITIGRPLAGVQAYIAGPGGMLAPPGVAGELLIGGDCLARGYIADKEKTDAAFIPDPYCAGKIVYRTGDLVRLAENGEIEYAGRIDSQVKIRGYRIELGEIRSRLAAVKGIDDCAVVALGDSGEGKYLCAYITGKNTPPRREIQAALSGVLPHYMIPPYFVKLNVLPVTAGGKLDRRALPPPELTEPAPRAEAQAAFTATERILAGIWERVLKKSPQSRFDNFFEMGGDSMSIISAANLVSRDLNVDVSLSEVYKNPTLSGYAALIDLAARGHYETLTRGADMPDYPVSAGQRRIFVLDGLENSSVVYNMPAAFRIEGEFDARRFTNAVRKLIKLHPSLRTGFFMKGGDLRQKIYKDVDFSMGRYKCRPWELDALLRSFVRPIDISRPPLLKAVCVELRGDDHVIFIDMHHIISDGVSADLLFKQLSELYSGGDVSPCALRYADYAVWQKGYLASEGMKRQRDYWLKEMSGGPPSFALRTDYPRPKRQSFNGMREEFVIPSELCGGIRAYASAKGVTAYTVMLAAYYILLARYSGCEDIVVGIPAAGRSRAEFDGIVGMFVNTLALRARPEAAKSCADFIAEVNKTVIGGMINQDYPFEMLVNSLALPRDLARNPLFDVFFSYNTSALDLKLEGARVDYTEIASGISKFDLTFEIRDFSGDMYWRVEYCADLFSSGTIKNMSRHYLNILRSIIADDARTVSKTEILTPPERERLITRMRGPEREIPGNLSYIGVLLQNARETPDAPALIFGDRRVSFGELAETSGRLAGLLRAKGVGAGSVVVVSLPRSIELAAAIIGVLRAGAAYLPIDTAYPADRIAFMTEESRAVIAIAGRALPGGIETITPERAFSAGNPPLADGGAAVPQDPDSTAYVLFTSGSTGRPKGVCVTRGNLLNYCEACREYAIFKPADVSASVTTISFDIFVLEFLTALYFKAAAAICDEEEQRVPEILAGFIKRCGASFIQFTPSRLALMMESPVFCAALAGVKTIVCGGEQFPLELLERLKKLTRARIMNGYGPTEATVHSSFKDLTKAHRVTIGKAVLNTDYYIVDKSMNIVPEGVAGELYIGGRGVASGYHMRPELTAERFVPDVFRGRGTMYKSGDLACLLPNGEFDCLGRADDQIKLNGLRIEPGEIEKAMLAFPDISKAVVVLRKVSGADKLCAYYTASREVPADILRPLLMKTLPVYMIPAHLVRMDGLPMTPSGKVDKKALPEIAAANAVAERAAAPMTEAESAVAKVWAKVLGAGQIGPDDDFFLLGGDSAAVIRAQIELMKTGRHIRTQDFYENPTVRSLCAHIAETKRPAAGAVGAYPAKAPSHIPGGFHMKKVLLTGATGFLGAHILKELSDLHNCEVVCLVRSGGADEGERLRKTVEFYFGQTGAARIMRAVTVVSGSLDGSIRIHGAPPDAVINCAAETRHFGGEKLFERANVAGVENLIKFCKESGAGLCHISTVSVSGEYTREKNAGFAEDDFYIGQNYADNPYVKSKFMAEALILKAAGRGLRAKIMRVGNLMPRYSDGVFQINPDDNAFFNRLRAFRLLGIIPESAAARGAEFTPVDQCAKAVVLLAGRDGGFIYHLFNPERADGWDVIGALNACGGNVARVSDADFAEGAARTAASDAAQNLGGIVEDLSRPAAVGNAIDITCKKTAAALLRLGFKWDKPDGEYLKRALAGKI